MRILQQVGYESLDRPVMTEAAGAQGLAGWVMSLLRNWRDGREVQEKQLRVLETLPLGGKRQLMLVSCAGERFLVGGGPESVETIVRLKGERYQDASGSSVDEPCQ
jgi:flagellar biogenesis protein FliO